MEDTCPSVPSPAATQPAPLHDDIAQCARDLWVKYGRPADRDLAIWLEAEQRLRAATEVRDEKNFGAPPPLRPASTQSARATVRTGAPVLRAAALPARSRTKPIL
jgi:hypothetical protein